MSASVEPGRPSAATPTTLDRSAEQAVSTLHRIIVPTDEGDAALARTREVALYLAREHDIEVVLYDRSGERWTDTPHPAGPLSGDEIDAERRPHLVRQLRDFEAAGVAVTAWLATVPALTAMLDALQQLDVDGVLLPEHLDEPKVMDRLQAGSDTAVMVDRVAELQMPTPPTVLVVPDSGPVRVVDPTGGHGSRPIISPTTNEENS